IFKADNFIISKYFTLETVTGYFITYKLYSIADMLHQQLFNQTRPYFVQLYGKNEHDKFAILYKILYNCSFLTACLGGFLIYLINEWFITHWLGTNYFLGNSLNFWMCLNFIIQSSVLPNRIVLVSTLFKVKENGISRLIEGIIKITISLLLIPIIGVEALAVSGIIASVLLSSLYFNYLAGQLVKQNNFSNVISTLLLSFSIIVLFTDNLPIKVSVLIFTILAITLNVRKSLYDGRIYLQQVADLILTKYRSPKNV
ncbi:MAG: lipopolysaccharide biosynthesis protein, partial [Bacteroidia bacterium]